MQLREPQLICLPRPGIEERPVLEHSVFEIMLALEGFGWGWKPLPPKARRAILQREVGSKSEQWFGTPERAYLSVLYSAAYKAPQLFVNSGVTAIAHCQPSKHYTRILNQGYQWLGDLNELRLEKR